jgi:hypothetical protein
LEERTQLPLLKTIFRLLAFRLTREEFDNLDLRFLLAGFVGTWVVGMGRYWDSPTAMPLQKLGIGSLGYVLALSLLLYLVGLPLMPRNWSYRSVLTFITLTSFPAALYAIPVERWASMDDSIRLNVWFLAVVALYRVALYLFYMGRAAALSPVAAITAVMMPICFIISWLTISGYSGVVFDIMGGLRGERSSMDGVNEILTAITFGSCLALPFWLLIYGGLATYARQKHSV